MYRSGIHSGKTNPSAFTCFAFTQVGCAITFANSGCSLSNLWALVLGFCHVPSEQLRRSAGPREEFLALLLVQFASEDAMPQTAFSDILCN